MQTSTRFSASQDRRWLVLALLTLLLIALPARAQDVTIEEKQSLDELEFTYDLTIGNGFLFAGGDALIRYRINGIGQAVAPATIPYNGDPVALAATDALLAVGDFASTLTLFDITDPGNPVERGTANTAGATLDIVARGDLVFTTPDIFTANNVVEIFDVSDPDNPVRVSQYRPGAFAAALFLADSGAELLVVTEEKLEIVDVSDPANPALLGSVALAGRGAEVTMLGTTAFVGSQQPENPQTGETPGWFLEAFDVSDPGNPQLLAVTGDNDGPMLALIRIEDEYLLASVPSGLEVFAFETSTGAFKTMDFMPSGGLTGVTPSNFVSFSPTDFPDLPNNCIPVITTANTTPEPGAHGQIDSSGDGPSIMYQFKLPPVVNGTLITGYAAPPRVECPGEPGTGVNIGAGTVSAEEEGVWTLFSMDFHVETAAHIASIRKEFIEKIELLIAGKRIAGDLKSQSKTVTNPVTGDPHTLNYITDIVFSGMNEKVIPGVSLPYTIELFTKGVGNHPICSVLEPVKRQIVQLSIHGVNDVGAAGPRGGIKLPNVELVGGVIDMACVIDVTPDPDKGFGFIQAGIDGSANGDRVGVCPGVYEENVTFSETQTDRTLFSFKGPRETEIRSLTGASDVVVTIEGNETTVQGFSITQGSIGVNITEGVARVLIGLKAASKQGLEIKALTLCNTCNRLANNETGVLVVGKDAQIRGNFIGTDAEGQTARFNTRGIMVLKTGTDTRIDANLISGNSKVGISDAGKNTIITGNIIGLNRLGVVALPNEDDGIFIGTEADGARIGGKNVISSNEGEGILVAGKNTQIFGNIIGLTESGVSARPNGGNGIYLLRATDTRIGGLTADSLNIISANAKAGISIDNGTDRVRILGNIIGLNALGNTAAADPVGNNEGIYINRKKVGPGGSEEVSYVKIGGAEEGASNVISGNIRSGIRVEQGMFDLIIQGNIIGLDPNGDQSRGNGLHGIDILSQPAEGGIMLIGGSVQSASNIISSNTGDGVSIDTYGIVEICGNIIGLDKQSMEDRGNGGTGVRMVTVNIPTIGGDDNDGDGEYKCLPNIISANGESGIDMEHSGGTILGNYMGVGFSEEGPLPRPNGKNGVRLFRSGGEFRKNTIQGNGNTGSGLPGTKIGILVIDSPRAELLSNTIRENRVGLVIKNSSPIKVIGNKLEENHTCAQVSNSKGVGVGITFFGGNFLKDCNGSSTGLHLTDVENALIVGNHFENTTGAGVMIEGASSGITVSRNNFIGNPDFGILNQGTDPIDATGNFWGAADGPSGQGAGAGDAVSAGVDFGGFLAEMVSVVVVAPDTAAVTIGAPDSVAVFFQNFADLTGTLSVSVTDEFGWLTGASSTALTFAVTLEDSLGGRAQLAILVPEGTPEGIENHVTIDAVSTTDTAQFDSFTLVLVADDPTTNVAIEANPEADADLELPDGYRLSAAYPNPFNPQAQFVLTLGSAQQVQVAVYDVLGRRVALLHDGVLAAQQPHRFVIDGASWPSGVYYYQVIGPYLRETRPVMLVK